MLCRSVAQSAGSGSRAPERAWWLARPIGLRPITTDSRLLCLIRTRHEDGRSADCHVKPHLLFELRLRSACSEENPYP
jgi:hypothetical protein